MEFTDLDQNIDLSIFGDDFKKGEKG